MDLRRVFRAAIRVVDAPQDEAEWGMLVEMVKLALETECPAAKARRML